jgi:glycyl-tRNA synthetase
MESLFSKNGLIFWSEQEIKARRMVENFVVSTLSESLKCLNRGFEVVQVEAPILTPRMYINASYSDDDMFVLDPEDVPEDGLILRPETTMGSYIWAKKLLDPYQPRKIKLPLVVWQHGKSFRREQDQVSKNMRLKEFYQLEFQIIYSPDTKNDYTPSVIATMKSILGILVGPVRIEASDRLPSYSTSTTDVICEANNMEVCSISNRTDFENAKVLEVAVGSDRCVYNFMRKMTPEEA